MPNDERPGLRIGDAEREATAALLRRHATDGRLTLDELDERLQLAYAARTAGELNALLEDLPDIRPEVELVQPTDTPARPQQRAPSPQRRTGVNRAAWASWAAVSSLNVLIWGIVCLATLGFVYPWWIWVAGPWGAALLAGEVGRRAHQREIGG